MRIFSTLAVTAFLAVAAAPASANPITSIVVYGDSLSDNGNLSQLTGGIAPGPGYVNGRFSNGPVAVEQLAASLNVPLLDFAYGGATTGFGNIGDGGTPSTPGILGLPGIKTELGASLLNQALLPALPTSLVVVWGGADDFEALSTSSTLDDVTSAAKTAAANIDQIVGALQLQGATNFLVPNLPDLSRTPEFSGNPAANLFTTTFNQTLAATLPTGATLFDTNAVFTSILSNPGNYGFSNVTGQCMQTSATPVCNGYLFFDDIHPTTAVDTILAQDFAAAVTPEPSSLVLLGTGLVGAIGVMRRRLRGEQPE